MPPWKRYKICNSSPRSLTQYLSSNKAANKWENICYNFGKITKVCKVWQSQRVYFYELEPNQILNILGKFKRDDIWQQHCKKHQLKLRHGCIPEMYANLFS